MSPQTWQDWIAWAGLVLPLAALAGSAASFVHTWRGELKHKRYQKFFELMELVGKQDGSIAGKMAAVYEMRKYPEYKEVIIRLCKDVQVDGYAKELLEREFDLTAKHFGDARILIK